MHIRPVTRIAPQPAVNIEAVLDIALQALNFIFQLDIVLGNVFQTSLLDLLGKADEQ